MSVQLGFNAHGKSRVRLVKITKKPDGMNFIQQLNVQILLEGDDMAKVFLNGDNKSVVATDTCKNTVYCLASQHDFQSIEEFGIIIVKHFLKEYPNLVNKISVSISSDTWERLSTIPDSKGRVGPHKHAFKRVGPKRPFTNVQGELRRGSRLKLALQSGFSNLEILKTTQSGFEGFHRDRYTSLPEVKDRLLGTSVTATWAFNPTEVQRHDIKFHEVNG